VHLLVIIKTMHFILSFTYGIFNEAVSKFGLHKRKFRMSS
jgi:hypothetical protein